MRGKQNEVAGNGDEPTTLEALKEANQQLRLASDQLHAILDQGLFMARLKLDGTLVDVNRSALEVPGYKREQVFGRLFWDCGWWNRSPEVQEWIKQAVRQAASGEVFRGDSLYFWADGSEHFVDFACLPIRDGEGKVVLLVATGMDITERVQAEQQRLALEEARQRTEALSELDRAKTAFFSNVSHEFRTPLTLMLGPLEDNLAKAGLLPPEVRQREELAYRNALRLLKLVNSLLDFSRIEAGRVRAVYRPTDLAQLTTDLASLFRSATEKAGLKLIVECPALPEAVFVDREMWEKIVLNLLSNAFKFTFEGQIEVSLRAVGHAARLKVRDTGTGIPAHELPRLFERFHRVEGARGRSYEGSGIGLSLIQELVKIHGGTISVDSALGRGTEFTVEIPLGTAHLAREQIVPGEIKTTPSQTGSAFVEEALRWLPEPSSTDGISKSDMRPTDGANPPSPPLDGRRARILLADDNADMRDYVKNLLESRTWQVEAVGDGEAALGSALQQPPDLVLTDIMMPGMDGFQLLKQLRANPLTDSIPVILLSARAGEEAKIEGLQAGADDYLIKPFSANELLARVDTQLRLVQSRRETERARQDLHEFFMQAPAALVMLLGPEHRFSIANPPYEKLVGGRNVTGKTVLEVFTREEVGSFVEILDRVYQTGVPYIGQELPLALKGESGEAAQRYLNVGYHPFRDRDGTIKGILAVHQDVTDQVLAKQAADNANRTKDKFMAVLSHELRTPLTPVLLAASELERRPELPASIREEITMIRRNVELQGRLIDDLLDMSRIISGKMRLDEDRISLNEAATRASEICRSTMRERGIHLSLDLADDLRDVRGDSARLQQVLWNLLSNATKFTPAGGHVYVRTESDDRVVRVIVRDTGRGIEPEKSGRIFDAFEQGEAGITREFGGLGLGLAICRAIVEQLHGTITASSEGLAKGSSFTVELPALPRRSGSASSSASGAAADVVRPLAILMVEDHPDTARVLARMLGSRGHAVKTAANGAEALALVDQHDFDVVVSDLGLPDIHGADLMLQIKARKPLKAIAMSGYGLDDDLHRSREAGFEEHLIKPVKIERLEAALRRIASNGHSA